MTKAEALAMCLGMTLPQMEGNIRNQGATPEIVYKALGFAAEKSTTKGKEKGS